VNPDITLGEMLLMYFEWMSVHQVTTFILLQSARIHATSNTCSLLCRSRMRRPKRCTTSCFCCCPKTPMQDHGPCLRASSRKCAKVAWSRSKHAPTTASPSSTANIPSWPTTSILTASAVLPAALTAGCLGQMVRSVLQRPSTTCQSDHGYKTSSATTRSPRTLHRTTRNNPPGM
jgi:hypothetical protein